MNLPIMDGNFNKNYRLPLERLCGRKILEIVVTGGSLRKRRVKVPKKMFILT
jgi:hypothetical protein